jgi:hypothetical protein
VSGSDGVSYAIYPFDYKVPRHSKTFQWRQSIKVTNCFLQQLPMSDYDRFANWVKEQRRCPEDALETTITQIEIKFVRSIMKGIDESKGTTETAKKTGIEKAKAFLLKCYIKCRLKCWISHRCKEL